MGLLDIFRQAIPQGGGPYTEDARVWAVVDLSSMQGDYLQKVLLRLVKVSWWAGE